MSIASEISRLQQAKEDLATAIGNKGVTVSVSATLDDFADYVDDIVTGITPTGTKSITTNGTHDVTNYASASVAVPASAVDSGTKSITTNGTHDVVGYASASVNVPSSSPTLISKSITANGTYNASADSADGYSSVTVNVPSGGGLSGVSASFYVLGEFYYIDENCVSQSGNAVSSTTITALAGSYIVILAEKNLATDIVNCTVVVTKSLGNRANYKYMEILQVSGGA